MGFFDFLGFGGNNTPAPIVVNAGQTASQQAQFNEEAARKQRALNMTWQEGPQGSLSYLPTGTETEGIPDMKAVTTLSEGQQGLYDNQVDSQRKFGDIASSQLDQVQSRLSTPFGLDGFGERPAVPYIGGNGSRGSGTRVRHKGVAPPTPPAPTGGQVGGNYDPTMRPSPVPGVGVSMAAPAWTTQNSMFGDPAATQQPGGSQYSQQSPQGPGLGPAPQVNPEVRQRQQEAILNRFSPQLDRDQAALRQNLANQGFQAGSEGYDEAMQEHNRARNDFYLGADVQAGDEMSRMFALENAGRARDINEMNQDYTFATNARDRAIQEEILARNQPMSELSSLMTGSQPKDPRFVPTPQGTIAAPDYMSGVYTGAGQQNSFNLGASGQNQAANAANQQGLFGLVGTAGKLAGATYGGPDGWTWK